MPTKRKAESVKPDDANMPAKKKGKDTALSSLIPIGSRASAVKGVKDVHMLHMLVYDEKKEERKELHFKKIVHADVNWDNTEHIKSINQWRNQVYTRAGVKAKTVCMWSREEEAWLELYYHLITVQGSMQGLQLPKYKDILEDFNGFFVGRVVKTKAGASDDDSEPCEARKQNPFTSKLNRVVKHIKDRLEYLMLGKTGDFYRPAITLAMLAKYMELRDELKESKVMVRKITKAEDDIDWQVKFKDGDEWANNDHWQKFWAGVLELPALGEKELAEKEHAEKVLAKKQLAEKELVVKKLAKKEAAEKEAWDLSSELSEVPDDFDVDMDESQFKAADSSDADSRSGDESSFVEGDTGITEPDVAETEVVADKPTSTAIINSTALQATGKGNIMQPNAVDTNVDIDPKVLPAMTNAAQVNGTLQTTPITRDVSAAADALLYLSRH